MFIYEKGNSLNLTFKGSIPVDNPEVVIKGFVDGVTMTVNGTVFGSGSEEFEGKAKTLVYQKDGKLMITFRGVAGIDSPEITLDEVTPGTVDVVVDGTAVTLNYTADGVTVAGKAVTVEEEVEPEKEPEVKDEEPEVEPEDLTDELPDQDTEE